jgi:hypothetical protein
MDLSFCENVIIKFLFTNEELRNRTLPYIVPEIFDDYSNITIIKVVRNFYAKFESFPSMQVMKLELPDESSYKKLIEILNIDLDAYSHEYLLDECEVFIKQKLTKNHFFECSTLLKDCKFEEAQQFPDKIRESLAFSFDTNLGLNFLEDEQRIYDFLHGRDRIVPYNISFLDRNTKGGAHEKSITLILAESNLGKTLIMASLAANNIRANKKVLYITCEMAENKISERVLANIWDHNIGELDIINRDSFHNRYEEMRRSINGSLQIKEYAPRCISSNDIRNLLKEYEVKKKFKPDIVYLDYLDLINPIYGRKSDNSYTEGKRKVEEFRGVAVDHEIPFISAIQTNRDGIGKADLDMNNTSDSIGFIYTADVVFAVTQPEQFREQNKFAVNILKNRYGFNKVKGAIAVDKIKMRIGNLQNDEEENLDTLRRPAASVAPTVPIIDRAMNSINSGLSLARETIENEMFGDWQ